MKIQNKITILLIFIITILMLNQSVYGETVYSEKWINPIWRHLPSDHQFPVPEIGKTPRTTILCTSYEAFKNAVQQKFENRSNSFIINLVYDFDFNEVESIIKRACDEIMDEDGYIGGNLYSRQYGWTGGDGNVNITFTVTYWTSYEQEQMVTTRVEEVIQQIIVQGMNEEEKVKAIHDWIVLNVEYDQTYKKHSAYDALFEEKETVCQGYTLLVIRMLREVNITSKYVSGYGNGGSHAWNLIYVCGSWYQLDVTWDDPLMNPPNPDYVRWDYYLISDSEMSKDHSWETSDYPAAPATFQDGDCDSVIPEVTTASVSDVTQTSAQCGGNVASDGGSTVTSRGVCWSTSPNPTITNNRTLNGSGTGNFVSYLSGLTSNTTYYVRAYATNGEGTAYGNELFFNTSATVTIPSVTTNSVTSITQTTASCGGNVASDGGSPVTARGVCWSTSSNPTLANSNTVDGSGTGSFTSSLAGLSPDTLYYVRAYATNSIGTSYGAPQSFTTQQESGGDLNWLTSRDAAVSAALSQGKMILLLAGRDTCGFTTYMRDTVCETTNPPIKNTILTHYIPWYCHVDNSSEWYSYADGLGYFSLPLICRIDPNDPYNYIDRSTNIQDEDIFYERLLDGIKSVPVVTTDSVTAVTQTTALCGGNVTSDGGAAVTSRGVCWSTSPNPTIAGDKLYAGSGTGSFSVTLTGLELNTTYYARAYATNSEGSAYGNEVSFTTLSHSLDQAIAVLQIMAGIYVPDSITLPEDINNDSRIGIAEAVYILMQLAAEGCRFAEDFEPETDASLSWDYTYSGGETWSVSDSFPHTGDYAAQTPDLNYGGRVSMQTSLISEGGKISFWYAQSNAPGYSQITKFYIDNSLKYAGSGSTGYTKISYPISAGEHQLKWEYESSNSSSYTQTGHAVIDDICSD